jgi:hypothetical protein
MGWQEHIYDFTLTITGEPSGTDTNYSGTGERGFYELPGAGGSLPNIGDTFKNFSTIGYCPTGQDYPGIVATNITYTKAFIHPDSIGNANATSKDGRKAIVKYSSGGQSAGLTPLEIDERVITKWSGQSQIVLMPGDDVYNWQWTYTDVADPVSALPDDADLFGAINQDIPFVVPKGTITVNKRLKPGDFDTYKTNFIAKVGKINEEEMFTLPAGSVLLSTFDSDEIKDEFGRDRVSVTTIYEYQILPPYHWNGLHSPLSQRADGTGRPVLVTVSPGAGPGNAIRFMYDYADISL